MKTLLISEVFPPQTGGSGRWFWEVYSRLPRESVVIAAGEFPGAAEFDRGHDVNVIRLPLSMPAWGFRSLQGFKGYWRLFWELRRLVREHNVQAIHAGRVLPEGWLAWMLGRWCGIPFMVYVHGEELSYGDHSRELAWMMRRVFSGSERVIVNSQNTKRLVHSHWKVSDERLTMLHPGVDTQRFRPSPRNSKIRGTLGWADRTVILTVGRLQKRKGHDMLIRALPQIRESVPNVLYAIVGEGEQRTELQNLVLASGVSDSVQFLGELPDEPLIQCYQQCDLFVLPNREVDGDFEGFGMVLLEAQACGKPVIAGDSGGTAETMIPDKTGLIADCTSPVPLAAAVMEILCKGKPGEMAQASRDWVVERFDWSSLACEAAEVFGLDTGSPSKHPRTHSSSGV
jgi:phosphatidylinositol alpha-1,6-mannosyltransferase